MNSIPRGFGNFAKGTHKEILAQVFAEQGREATVKKAEQLGVKKATIRTWMCIYRRRGLDKK